jgi:hypothetical protein
MESVVTSWQDTVPSGLDSSDCKQLLSLLDQYPRVRNNIADSWGTEKGRKVIVGLLVDDRNRHNNKVQGFPAKIYAVLNALHNVYST